jgi:hypothetical protein
VQQIKSSRASFVETFAEIFAESLGETEVASDIGILKLIN